MPILAQPAPEAGGDLHPGKAVAPCSYREYHEVLADLQKRLADQEWILEQYLHSPSWRLTAPLRWMSRSFRGLVRPAGPPAARPAGSERAPMPDWRWDIASYRAAFEAFTASDASLNLPAPADPEISVLLVLSGQPELTFACLRSILANPFKKIETIIVADAPAQASADFAALLDRVRGGARILKHAEEAAFPGAVNRAAAAARGRVLLLLSSQAQLLPGALDAAVAALDRSSDIGAACGRIIGLSGGLLEAGGAVLEDGSRVPYGCGDLPNAPQYMFRRDVYYGSARFLMTPREVWASVGGFAEEAGANAAAEFCERLWRRGLRVVYEPASVVLDDPDPASTASSVREPAAAEAENQTAILRGRMRHRSRRVLMVDDRLPHRRLGSGFPRAHALLHSLLKQGCFITMYPVTESVHDWNDWNAAYTEIAREVEIMDGGRPLLETFLERRSGYYDLIVVSRPHNMQILRPILLRHPEWFCGARIIYDAEAVFARREAGRRKLGTDPMPQLEFMRALNDEISQAAIAETTLSVSEAEADFLRRHGVSNVAVLGHALEPAPGPAPFISRAGLLFVGAMHGPQSPNGESLAWFLRDVFPLIRRQLGDDVELIVAGVNTAECLAALKCDGRVRALGCVPDLTPVYAAARVFIAPTRYGAGIPHKVHEAAAHGLPAVATPLLAEQLNWTDRELGIGGTAEMFAAQTVELYRDEEKWLRTRTAALESVSIDCSPERFDRKVRELLEGPSLQIRSHHQ